MSGMSVSIPVDIDIESLLDALRGMHYNDLFYVITEIDEMVCELDFTERLANHFTRLVESEIQADGNEEDSK